MKIQYPGVADSVESDLKNLQRLVQLTNILPPGLYIDEIIEVGLLCADYECVHSRPCRFMLVLVELLSCLCFAVTSANSPQRPIKRTGTRSLPCSVAVR